ncbi:hypothetical protein V8C42DRAFT_318007 [Trichoderma barbatum]
MPNYQEFELPAGTPEATKAVYQDILLIWFKAWETKDFEDLASRFTADAQYYDYHAQYFSEDIAGVRKWFEICADILDDISFDVRSVHGDSKNVTFEAVMNFTWAKDFKDFKKGDKVSAPGAAILQFDEAGKIKSEHDYFLF